MESVSAYFPPRRLGANRPRRTAHGTQRTTAPGTIMRDDNASHWLTLSLYTGLLLAFLLAACVSAAWPHLHPSSVEILAPTATTVQLELVFAAADAATLVALAPAGLRRDAAARLRDALRAVPGAIRWRVRVSARQAVLPSTAEDDTSAVLMAISRLK